MVFTLILQENPPHADRHEHLWKLLMVSYGFDSRWECQRRQSHIRGSAFFPLSSAMRNRTLLREQKRSGVGFESQPRRFASKHQRRGWFLLRHYETFKCNTNSCCGEPTLAVGSFVIASSRRTCFANEVQRNQVRNIAPPFPAGSLSGGANSCCGTTKPSSTAQIPVAVPCTNLLPLYDSCCA